MSKLNVTIWCEHQQDKTQADVIAAYPNFIHNALKDAISPLDDVSVRTATLDMPECGLPDEVLNSTDVLLWWGHQAHDAVPDALARKVADRVLLGMGLIVLHSAHYSKPFRMLMGTTCSLRWRDGDFERLWTLNPTHPIADGIPMHVEIGPEEMYGEPFDIPRPDDVVFGGWFRGGELCRSGCTFTRGAGKVFYFQPGHESNPTYHHPIIRQILRNAVKWAAPSYKRGRLGCFHDNRTTEAIVAGGKEIDM